MLKSALNIAPRPNVGASLARPQSYVTQTMATKWQYQSGAAKRKAKKQRIASEAKGKKILEELG